MSDSPSKTVVVKHEQGLHARPAEMVARAAMSFESQVDLVFDGRRIDAKSILNILTLGAAAGSTVEVHATGADAAQAVEALARLIESDFESDQFPIPTQGGAAQGGALG